MTSYDSRPDTVKHITTVQRLGLKFAEYLGRRLREHDASKLKDPELTMFNEYTPRLRELTYGSDEYKETLGAMGEALRHHYEHNRHHPEHFENGIRDMNLIDLVEMMLDWTAAVLRHDDGNLSASVAINAKRFGMSKDLEFILANTVSLLEKWTPYQRQAIRNQEGNDE